MKCLPRHEIAMLRYCGEPDSAIGNVENVSVNAALELIWLLPAGGWARSSYDLILLVQSLIARSCTHEGVSTGWRSRIMTRSVL